MPPSVLAVRVEQDTPQLLGAPAGEGRADTRRSLRLPVAVLTPTTALVILGIVAAVVALVSLAIPGAVVRRARLQHDRHCQHRLLLLSKKIEILFALLNERIPAFPLFEPAEVRAIDQAELRELLVDAWRMVVPERVALEDWEPGARRGPAGAPFPARSSPLPPSSPARTPHG